MKLFILLYLSLFMINTFAQVKKDETIDARKMTLRERLAFKRSISDEQRAKVVPVEEQAEKFLNNLQENGRSGIESSRAMLAGLDKRTVQKEQGIIDADEFLKIENAMLAKGGKIKEIGKLGEAEDGIGGLKKVLNYQITYENGKTQVIEFTYYKVDTSSGLKLMDIKVKD